MDRHKVSGVAHGDHTFWSPLSAPKADILLGLIPLVPGDRVLDVGCGPAELLIRLAAGLEAWDLTVCVGASGAHGGCRGALEALRARPPRRARPAR